MGGLGGDGGGGLAGDSWSSPLMVPCPGVHPPTRSFPARTYVYGHEGVLAHACAAEQAMTDQQMLCCPMAASLHAHGIGRASIEAAWRYVKRQRRGYSCYRQPAPESHGTGGFARRLARWIV